MNVEMTAQVRNRIGKMSARAVRREEQVPAIVYGPAMEALPVTVSARRLEKLLKDMGSESKLIQLTVEGGEAPSQTRQVLIREVQTHPFRRQFLHVDFYEVPLDRLITVNVPVETVGECVGVKKGGTLNLIRRTVSVRCLPGQIPDRVHVDISSLDLGETIHVGTLAGKVPFDLVDPPSFAVVNIVAPEGKSEGSQG